MRFKDRPSEVIYDLVDLAHDALPERERPSLKVVGEEFRSLKANAYSICDDDVSGVFGNVFAKGGSRAEGSGRRPANRLFAQRKYGIRGA